MSTVRNNPAQPERNKAQALIVETSEPKQRKSANSKKDRETMNNETTNNETDNTETGNTETAKAETASEQTGKGSDKGKAKPKRKARKSAKGKGSDRKPIALSKGCKGILDTIRIMIALPHLAKAFGGEVQKLDLPRIQKLATDKPKAFRALNAMLGSTDRHSPLRLKKSALAAFVNVHTSTTPSFGEKMTEALNGKPASTVDKLTLTVALLDCLTVTDIRVIWTQYANYMNG
jgi:hypothetical protein